MSQAEDVSARLGCELWCVSSKTGEGITGVFTRVAAVTFDAVMRVNGGQEERKVIGESLVGKVLK